MTNETKSILLAGVGGQGILRASDILSLVLIEAGYDAKKSEVHGMAQRGGCVTSHIRYGKKVYSPIAKKGDVNIMVSFEKVETLRYLDFLKPDGAIIINDVQINPPSVNLGEAHYPNNIAEIVEARFSDYKVVNALEMAFKSGNARTVNIALLGVLSSYLDISPEHWENVIRKSFPEKAIKANLEAFNYGRNV